MQPSAYSANNSNISATNFWSTGGFRKRKANQSDLDDRANQKMFLTEDKVIKEMQTLSLDLQNLNNATNVLTPQIDMAPVVDFVEPFANKSEPDDEFTTANINDNATVDDDDDDSSDEEEKKSQEAHIRLHDLLKDSLKNDNYHDDLLRKLCENERRKLTMQIVPYMPIHPSQVDSNIKNEENENVKQTIEEIDNDDVGDSETKVENGDYIFKMPSIPTAYTVEEPNENVVKRNPTMKRSYSQSNQSSNNLLVTELKSDESDDLINKKTESNYFIIEPKGNASSQSLSCSSSSSSLSMGTSVRITEFIENGLPNNEFTASALEEDDIDMQSIASSDTGDKMDDD